MDFDLLSAAVGAVVSLATLASLKFLPKLAKKTDNKIDDALVAQFNEWIADPANQAKAVEWFVKKIR